ncbi:hypothetical protein FDP41_010547 [Naegleria fowleri]|uniref:Cytochrome b5 heme-binding domain-containing protein n=1 Tax=Naegleria fowleri TaxID=5763 RepID=A0A6A5C958_NAEFO|nr:uncharacterized protein FDP41_010547 [Naegleria fowleri]KAF0983482.1 hypothetical protein FDP41_010547 [Naegleria fowleri]
MTEGGVSVAPNQQQQQQTQTEESSFSWDEIKHLLQDSDVFQLSSRKAWTQVLMTIGLLTLGIVAAAQFPWYLLPVSWIFIGLSATGLMGVAYACSENRFFNHRTMPVWVNDLVGVICMLPLLYPFETFKSMYSRKTEQDASSNGPNSTNEEDEGFFMKTLVFMLKSPLWFLSSIIEWFRANIYFESKRSIVINAVVLYAFAAAFFSLMLYFVGLWGLIKFYVAPLIAYHLINSTFMKVNDADAKKNRITHFPSIIEFLTNYANHSYRIKLKWNKKNKNGGDITQSLKEKLTNLVPNYNWNKAKNALREKFGKNLEKIGGTSFFSALSSTFENEVDLRNIDWFITIYLIGSLVGSIYGVLTAAWNWKTYLLSFIGYYVAGIGITAGYHRIFAHRSCSANWPTRVFFMLLGTSAFQGSVVNWSADHRRHHQYVDTDRDPYNIKNSFFYAHMGWLLWKREVDTTNAKDLLADPVIKFHHDNYPVLALLLGYIIPMCIAGFGWSDWYGGFFIAGVLSKTFLQHCTFFINSLAHTWGTSTFNDDHTAKDSYLVSLFTFGEGYHNFHHTFAYDYRNGVHWYHYDPGKWIIYTLSLIGWTYDLKRCDPFHYEKGRIIMEQKNLDDEKKLYNWGTPIDQLPTKTWEDFEKDKKEKSLVIIDNVVHDVTNFMHEHPGGEAILKSYLGRDVTSAFNGDVYKHTNVAKNILAQIRIYKLPPKQKQQ